MVNQTNTGYFTERRESAARHAALGAGAGTTPATSTRQRDRRRLGRRHAGASTTNFNFQPDDADVNVNVERRSDDGLMVGYFVPMAIVSGFRSTQPVTTPAHGPSLREAVGDEPILPDRPWATSPSREHRYSHYKVCGSRQITG